jgi:hypothetical protein
MKLVSVTWSYFDESNVEQSMIYQSFIKHNKPEDFINIHFNRSNFMDLEMDFEMRYGYQFEFLLYRIFLLKDRLLDMDSDVYIFSDTTDVVCLGNIDEIEYDETIKFSAERHQYPNDISSWSPVNSYSEDDLKNSNFLNAGLVISKKELFVSLLESVIEKVLPLNYRNFGGDQGVFTYYYANKIQPEIFLDYERNIFVSTYLTGVDWYKLEGGKITYKPTGSKPFFLHDNGWNYGSPKIIEYYKLS